jgi:hypothetical protein
MPHNDGHPHHERTERSVLYGAPVTFAIGTGMATLLTNSIATLSGVGIGTASVSAFALVHCMRINRRRRAQHKKQEVC